MSENYDYSFSSIVFGHSRVLKKLEQSDSVLISIANDHGFNDRWELVCSTCNKILSKTTTPISEQTPLLQEKVDINSVIHQTINHKENTNKILTRFLHFFKHTEYDIQAWYKEVSNYHNVKVSKNFNLSEPKDCMFDLICATKNVSNVINVVNSNEFLVYSYSLYNPPKSSKSHSVIALGCNHNVKTQKIGQLDECLYMRIYATRKVPKHSVTEAPRPLLLARLIRVCNENYCIDKTKIVRLYNYFSVELNNAMSFTCYKKHEKLSTVIKRIEEFTYDECLKLVKSKEIETNHHGPLLLLLFFESKSIKGFENMQILAKHLLDQMISKESCEKSLIDELKLIYNPIKNDIEPIIENAILSPLSVRMLLKELSTFCTKYSLRDASYASIAFSMFLKSWLEDQTLN